MNLGIYIQSLGKNDHLKEISECINKNIGTKNLTDASIFFDSIGFNPFEMKCGIFNSTDLWNFNGKLITTSLQTTLKALKIVNNIEVFYYYGLEDKISPLSLIYLQQNGVKIISRSEKDDNDLYRKTAHRSVSISSCFNDILNNMDIK